MADPKEAEKLKKMDKRRQEREANDAKPPITAFAIERTANAGWTFVTFSIKDDKVVDRKIKECMDKAHAIETFQIEFVNTFIYEK